VHEKQERIFKNCSPNFDLYLILHFDWLMMLLMFGLVSYEKLNKPSLLHQLVIGVCNW